MPREADEFISYSAFLVGHFHCHSLQLSSTVPGLSLSILAVFCAAQLPHCDEADRIQGSVIASCTTFRGLVELGSGTDCPQTDTTQCLIVIPSGPFPLPPLFSYLFSRPTSSWLRQSHQHCTTKLLHRCVPGYDACGTCDNQLQRRCRSAHRNRRGGLDSAPSTLPCSACPCSLSSASSQTSLPNIDTALSMGWRKGELWSSWTSPDS